MLRAAVVSALLATTVGIPDRLLQLFQSKANATISQLAQNYTVYPTEGSCPGCFPWAVSGPGGWTCGFWPGILWRLSNVSKDGSGLWWAAQANAYTAAIAVNQHNTGTHDVGFMTWGSFGQQFLLTGNATAAEILVTTAHSLAVRFVQSIGAFESWGPVDPSNHEIEVIVDNMMNLQLMFWAGAFTGNATLTDMAVSHADTTAANWFQPWCSGCVWHLVVFNSTSGAVLSRSSTPQGLAQNSVWSRGQAWAVNGFTLAYRYTRIERFLSTAALAADAFLRLLEASPWKSTRVPLWDFNATSPDKYGLDTSASLIAASGLVELSTYVTDPRKAAEYLAAAKAIVAGVTDHFLLPEAASDAVVGNGTSSFPDTGIPLVYGDYFLMDTLQKLDIVSSRLERPGDHAPAFWL